VYLLHFESRVGGLMQHYVGFTKRLPAARFQKHMSGESDTEFTRLATKRGLVGTIAKVWENAGPEFEQKLKREKNFKRHCPLCTACPVTGGVKNVRIS
jgi:predicted GIY-YIG superfamily endonuclease